LISVNGVANQTPTPERLFINAPNAFHDWNQQKPAKRTDKIENIKQSNGRQRALPINKNSPLL
jgi:hypothetical protein